MASEAPDLRSTLLRHGIDLARTGGAAAVSIRDVQRRAGVSHAAAYRHYADRQALLAAISDFAAAEMAAMMEAQIAAVPERNTPAATALRRLRAVGTAYLDFAAAEPGLFAIAFLSGAAAKTPPDPHADPSGTSPGPFQILSRTVDELVDAGVLEPARRPFTEVAAWAGVHGLATLFAGPLRLMDPDAKHAATERLLDLLGVGVASTGTGPPAVPPSG